MKLRSEEAKKEWLLRKKAMPDIPRRWDFHDWSIRNLRLSRDVKARLQVAMSKMDRIELMRNIEIMRGMQSDAKKLGKVTMEMYCGEVVEFGTKYLESLVWQKKI